MPISLTLGHHTFIMIQKVVILDIMLSPLLCNKNIWLHKGLMEILLGGLTFLSWRLKANLLMLAAGFKPTASKCSATEDSFYILWQSQVLSQYSYIVLYALYIPFEIKSSSSMPQPCQSTTFKSLAQIKFNLQELRIYK